MKDIYRNFSDMSFWALATVFGKPRNGSMLFKRTLEEIIAGYDLD
jgi:hypothetical protein